MTSRPPDAISPRWRYVVLHHSASAAGSAETFHRWRLQKGWRGLGDHFVVGNGTQSGDGQVEAGFRWTEQSAGAHAKGWNTKAVGIRFVGNFEHTRPSPAQVRSGVALTRDLQRACHIPASRVLRHKDVGRTACPGRLFPYEDILSQIEPQGRRRAWRRCSAGARTLSSTHPTSLPDAHGAEPMAMPSTDLQIVRGLAQRVAEIAAQPIHAERAVLWTRFNRLQPDRPMVLIFPEGAWRELLPDSELACESDAGRGLERDLRRRIYCGEVLDDDNVVSGEIRCGVAWSMTGWGFNAQRTKPDAPLGADHFEPVCRTDADLDKIQLPQVAVDWDATERRYESLCETFDGILPVVKQGVQYGRIAPVDMFSQWAGLENLFLDIVDRPQWVHRALQRIIDGHMGVLRALEEANALGLNNAADYCGSGGVGYSDELPQPDFDGEHVRPMDMWGFCAAQIFSEVSPAMHDEFALRYEKQWLENFGLNAYGCCEPLDKKMNEVKQIPRLRRISMSPWVDPVRSAQELEDKYIFSYKPNPAVMASIEWDADAVRKGIREFLEQTRGCVVELVMKDTHTCNHQPHRMADWTRIAKEEAERFAA